MTIRTCSSRAWRCSEARHPFYSAKFGISLACRQIGWAVHDAIARLEKLSKRKFTIGQRAEWDEYLTKETATLSALKRQIDLFGISPEEAIFIGESLRI